MRHAAFQHRRAAQRVHIPRPERLLPRSARSADVSVRYVRFGPLPAAPLRPSRAHRPDYHLWLGTFRLPGKIERENAAGAGAVDDMDLSVTPRCSSPGRGTDRVCPVSGICGARREVTGSHARPRIPAGNARRPPRALSAELAHCPGRPPTTRTSALAVRHGPAGRRAAGDALGASSGVRTRSAPGSERKRSGGAKTTSSSPGSPTRSSSRC